MSIWDRVDTFQKKNLPITEVYATTKGIYADGSRDHARTSLYHLFEILIFNLRAELENHLQAVKSLVLQVSTFPDQPRPGDGANRHASLWFTERLSEQD